MIRKKPQKRSSASRFVLLAAIGLLLVLVVIFALSIRSSQDSDSVQAEPEITRAGPTYTWADTVRRGDTLGGLLLRNRVGMIEIDRIIREIRAQEFFSVRAIRPGQITEFTHNEAGDLIRLVCRIAPEEVYVFELDPMEEALRSYAQAVDCQIRVRKIAGTVKTTFEEAVLSAGGKSSLALQMSEIVAGDIDFFTEIRRGDSFSILIEERYVDADLIGYGEILFGWYEGAKASSNCVYYRPMDGKGGHYDLEGGSLRRAFLKSPLNFKRISSQFSRRRFHPILKRYRPHHGVDYAAPTGTPVVTTADGVVRVCGWRGGYGRCIEIRHSPTHTTRYGHLSRFAKGIRKGVRVEQGQKIGYVGSTGLATGPHLHYEVQINGSPINPLTMKSVPAEPIPDSQLADFLLLADDVVAADLAMESGELLAPRAWEGRLLALQVGADSSSAVD